MTTTNTTHKLMQAASAIMLLLTGLLYGCVFGQHLDDNEPVELRCKAVMSKNTRDATPVSGFPETFALSEDFGLWAFSLPHNKPWVVYRPDASAFLIRKRFEGSTADELWHCSGNVKWPYSKVLTFIAYAPFEALGAYDSGKGIVFEDYDVDKSDYDLMFTEYITDQVNTTNLLGVAIPFEHALCKVDIKLRTPLTSGVVVKKIVFENLKYRGTFNSLPSPIWTPTTDTKDFVVYDSTAGWALPENNDQTVFDSARLLLPQTLAATIAVTAEFTTGMVMIEDTLRSTEMKVTWEPGKYYTYTLVLSQTSLTFAEPSSSD